MGKSGNPAKRAGGKEATKGIALYHVMRADEDFETTADMLHSIAVPREELRHPHRY